MDTHFDRAAAPAIHVIGDVCSPAMGSVRIAVEALVAQGADVQLVPALRDSTVRLPENVRFSQLVIVCQHWPDEFTVEDVRRLIGAYPLARLICCYGPWCESDGRSRDIWPLAVRVPVRAAADRIRRELDVTAGRRQPLPLTASRDEIFLFDADGPIVERLAYP